jgi:hypothetical protein
MCKFIPYVAFYVAGMQRKMQHHLHSKHVAYYVALIQRKMQHKDKKGLNDAHHPTTKHIQRISCSS